VREREREKPILMGREGGRKTLKHKKRESINYLVGD